MLPCGVNLHEDRGFEWEAPILFFWGGASKGEGSSPASTLCLFASPIASIVPSAATAPALIYVGVLMLKNFSKVDMDDLTSAIPAFVTLVMMPLTYSISNGIGLGAITYTLMKVFTGKFQKKDIMVAIIAVLFALRFVFVTM